MTGPVLLVWQGTGDLLDGHPDPEPAKDWAMITALLAWTEGHGTHGKVTFDRATQSITCEKHGPFFKVAPVRQVAA